MKSGQLPGVKQLHYTPAPGAQFDVEMLSFAQLRLMDRSRRRTRPQRPDFHVMALVQSGVGRHTADFIDHPLWERTVVWIRPGVVHRWTDVEDLEGPLLLFAQGFPPAPGPVAQAAANVFGPACWQLDKDAWELALRAADHLRHEHTAAVSNPRLASVPLLAHLLSALVLRVLPIGPAGPPLPTGNPHQHQHERGAEAAKDEHAVFRCYRAAVEERFAEHHHVRDYATALGYEPRTLTRATRAATGLGAKQFLDQRILLEAKRLLAHTDLPAARCAERLGFHDAANFTTFFQRQAGLSPSRWRTRHDGR
ncbi:AraC family transcriptional regulator [Streptomyces lydicus]|uniref:AraC family transcriptional regulator n=1 Tax=Streptomyces lydicus TaxID=47763 RepID=UPI001F512F43|nr:AraC family transcriptional regulator [Streptomyces lydicus]MCZ1011337.1 AraC family transcriptional regulator [Streptomyces lydicus]